MQPTDKKPLKRHPALVPLSQDHHFGLLLCWKIRTGIGKGIETERIVDYVKYFFADHLKRHFLEEEKYIFVLMDEKDPKRVEAEEQHRKIEGIVGKLDETPDSALSSLEKEIDKHIRFEERDLFPYVQQLLNNEELEKLRITIEEIHQRESDDWHDPFWVK
jgi:hemerythrin-like domain-containing protein